VGRVGINGKGSPPILGPRPVESSNTSSLRGAPESLSFLTESTRFHINHSHGARTRVADQDLLGLPFPGHRRFSLRLVSSSKGQFRSQTQLLTQPTPVTRVSSLPVWPWDPSRHTLATPTHHSGAPSCPFIKLEVHIHTPCWSFWYNANKP